MTRTDRHNLPLDGTHNIRDLGGLPLTAGGITRPGQFWRACAMAQLSDEGQRALGAQDIALVVDLRAPGEIAAQPGALANLSRRVEVPVFAALAPITDQLTALPDADLDARYITALQNSAAQFAQVFRAMAAAGDGITVFHCTAGKDRTGLVAALLLQMTGVPAERIAEDYALSATEGAPLLAILRRAALARGTDAAMVARILRADAASMLRVLDWLSRTHGGAAAYLKRAGVAQDDLVRLRLRLTP